MNLSENEINKRLIRLRNLENLHIKARERIVLLEKENLIRLIFVFTVTKLLKRNGSRSSSKKTSLCQFKRASFNTKWKSDTVVRVKGNPLEYRFLPRK